MVCQSLSSRCCNYDIVRDDNQVKFSLASSPNGIVIDKPGVYKVIKDIDWEAAKPTQLSSTGSAGITGTAITITSDDVTLDFCGHTIKQVNGNVVTFTGRIDNGTTGTFGDILTLSSITSGTLVPGLYLTGSSGPIGSSTVGSTRLTTYPNLNSTGTVSLKQNVSPNTTFYGWSEKSCIVAPNPVNNLKIVGPGTIRNFSSRAISLINPSTDLSTIKNVLVIDDLRVIQCNQANINSLSIIRFQEFCNNIFLQNCVGTQCLNGIFVQCRCIKNMHIDNVHVSKIVLGRAAFIFEAHGFTDTINRTNYFDNLSIKNCSVFDCKFEATQSAALFGVNWRNILMENCIFNNLTIPSGTFNSLEAIHVSGYDEIGRCVNTVFRNIIISNMFADNISYLEGISLSESLQNVLFDNCVINDLVLTGTTSSTSVLGVNGIRCQYSPDPGVLHQESYNIVLKDCKVSGLYNKRTVGIVGSKSASGYRLRQGGNTSFTDPTKGLRNVTFDNCIAQDIKSDYGTSHGIVLDGHALQPGSGVNVTVDQVLQNLIVKNCNLSAVNANTLVGGDTANSAGIMIAGKASDVLVCDTIINDNDNGLIISNMPSFKSNTLPLNVTVTGCKASYNLYSGFNNQVANTFYSNTYSFDENKAYFNGPGPATNYVGMSTGTPVQNWQVGLAPAAPGSKLDNLNRFV